jgi:acetyltransferase-like isoleucine patch superfamily enzyme
MHNFILKLAKLFVNKKKDVLFFTKDIFILSPYEIGEYTYGEPKVLYDNPDSMLKIGKFCSIAKGVTIYLGGNHRIDWISSYPFNVIRNFPEASNIQGHPATKGSVIIGNDVWLGRHSTIMSGVNIGNGVVVGAYSVVTRSIGPYEIWAGNPAKFVRRRFDEEIITKLEEIQWWNWDIMKIRRYIKILCTPDVDRLIEISKDNSIGH